MSTIHTPNIPPPVASAGPQNTATAVVVKAPPSLSTLPQGQALQATVTTTASGHQIQVQTPLGSITLQMGVAVPKGSVLTMVLTSLTPPLFQVAMVDGKPVPGALTAAQAKTAGLKGQLPLPTPPQTLQAGTKLNAVLLRPAAAAPQGAISAATGPAPQAASALSAGVAAQSLSKPAPKGGAA
ncbi:MAG: hypothetical protein JKY92_06785, partial [Magnetovibrio sp.]|nr:hypothetical protein [Magnetovibrio sp.]